MTAAAGIPVLVGNRPEACILPCKRTEGCIDGLLFRADQADLHLSLLQGEDLRTQHGRIRNADELKLIVLYVVPRDDEEPWPVGRAIDVMRLNRFVELLL